MKNLIKEFRKEKNLTQQDLADIVEVRRETIVFLEQNKYNPSLELAFKIAVCFDKPIEQIFIYEPSKIKQNPFE